MGVGGLVGFVLGLGGACQLPNPDHCFNLTDQPNTWCAKRDAARPFCSPCAAQDYGCVEVEPSEEECPLYTTPAPGTGESEEGGEVETGTGETGS